MFAGLISWTLLYVIIIILQIIKLLPKAMYEQLSLHKASPKDTYRFPLALYTLIQCSF